MAEYTHALNEEELSKIAGHLGRHFYRAGLLLGIQPHELDALREDGTREGLNSWQLNMQLLQLWRERCSAKEERRELARVLKRLDMGRDAVSIDPTVRDWKETSLIDSSTFSSAEGDRELSSRELEEISREVTDCWQRLATCLGVRESVIRDVEASRDEVSVQAFRCLWAWRESRQDETRETLARALERVKKGRLAHKLRPK